jgi:hypothetical protein
LELLKVIPGGHEVEAAWHKRFAHLRRHLEWFDQTDELLDAIDQSPTAARKKRATNPWSEPPVVKGDRKTVVVRGPCKACHGACSGCSVQVGFNGKISEWRYTGRRGAA